MDAGALDKPIEGARNVKTDVITLSIGVVLILVPLVFIVMFATSVGPASVAFLRIAAALGGALIGVSLPGILDIQLPGVRAGGALAIFVTIFFMNPPEIVVAKINPIYSASGKINTPPSGALVGHTFYTNGVARKLDDNDVSYYLAVGNSDDFWPKTTPLELDSNGKWSATVFQDSDMPSFYLTLIVANKAGTARIAQYRSEGLRTRNYPSMHYDNDITPIDRTQLSLKK